MGAFGRVKLVKGKTKHTTITPNDEKMKDVPPKPEETKKPNDDTTEKVQTDNAIVKNNTTDSTPPKTYALKI